MRISFVLLVFLVACSSCKDADDATLSYDIVSDGSDIRQLRLPFRLNTYAYLNERPRIVGYYTLNDVQIYVYNQYHRKPFYAQSVRSNGDLIDSIALLNDLAYVGVDSRYTPWIIFSGNHTIEISDTSFYFRYSTVKDLDSTILLIGGNDTAITTHTINISPDGHFQRN